MLIMIILQSDWISFLMNNRNGYTCRAGIFRGPIARGRIGRQNMPAVTVAPSISNAKTKQVVESEHCTVLRFAYR